MMKLIHAIRIAIKLSNKDKYRHTAKTSLISPAPTEFGLYLETRNKQRETITAPGMFSAVFTMLGILFIKEKSIIGKNLII